MTIVRLSDLRHPEVQVCRNARHWFERVGLDWRDFVRNGIDIEKLKATGQHKERIARLELVAKEREANGSR